MIAPGPAAAELIADRGAAAESDDLFRSRPFLDAERVTHTLRVASAERVAHVPVIVRAIGGSADRDAISPYGYPGARIDGAGPAPDAAEVDWEPTGLVSVFGRERLGAAPWLADPSARSRVLVHEPDRPRAIRPRLAEQIRANERAGWRVGARRGPESAAVERDAFALAYEQTMVRVGAARRYFFERPYFDAVLRFERSWLLSASRDGSIGAGAIAAISDGVLHYYLGGTADEARDQAPFKNVVAAMLDLADELALPLNLGGGVVAGDGLESFKRGFANAELAFRTHEVICDPDSYRRLARGGPEDGGFFPAYRAG